MFLNWLLDEELQTLRKLLHIFELNIVLGSSVYGRAFMINKKPN